MNPLQRSKILRGLGRSEPQLAGTRKCPAWQSSVSATRGGSRGLRSSSAGRIPRRRQFASLPQPPAFGQSAAAHVKIDANQPTFSRVREVGVHQTRHEF